MKFLIGLIVGILIVAAMAYLYFKLGFAPVAADDRNMPFEGWAAHTAERARLNQDMPRTVPYTSSPTVLAAGARLYKENCALCHGTPAQDQDKAAQNMFPKPPHLFRGKGVTDDPAGETYWKISNGIRLSGMPAYKSILSDEQRWQISLLLAYTGKLPPEAEQVLSER